MPEQRKRSSETESRGTARKGGARSASAKESSRSQGDGAARNSARRDEGGGLVEKLEAFGVNGQMIDGVKTYVVRSVEGKLRDVNVEESIDRVGEAAARSLRNVKRYSRNRPGLFYGGLLTLAVGAGLLIGAALENDEVEYEIEFRPER